jgi:transcriptional regulator with XRE-family HTH domain
MKLKDKVRAVLDSNLSQYAISKRTGVSQGSLSALRNGTKEIGKLSIDTAQKLADLYDEGVE